MPIPGVDYPRDMGEMIDLCSDERSCKEYLDELRWGEDGERFRCPSPDCDGRDRWLTDELASVCTTCSRRTSITAGTVFEKTRIPLRTWLLAAWLMTTQKSGTSAKSLEQVLGLNSYRTAWRLLHKLRLATVRPEREPLTGAVEVDETMIGGVEKADEGNQGRKTDKKHRVIIGVEINRDTGAMGRVRMDCIPDFEMETLTDFVRENVKPGAKVYTDALDSYNKLSEVGYRHATINLKEVKKEKDWEADEVLPFVHRVASLLTRWWLGTYQGVMSAKHIYWYLQEFTFRFNRRNASHRGLLFYRLLQYAVQEPSTTHQQLIEREAPSSRG